MCKCFKKWINLIAACFSGRHQDHRQNTIEPFQFTEGESHFVFLFYFANCWMSTVCAYCCVWLVQDCGISCPFAMEMPQSFINALIYCIITKTGLILVRLGWIWCSVHGFVEKVTTPVSLIAVRKKVQCSFICCNRYSVKQVFCYYFFCKFCQVFPYFVMFYYPGPETHE